MWCISFKMEKPTGCIRGIRIMANLIIDCLSCLHDNDHYFIQK